MENLKSKNLENLKSCNSLCIQYSAVVLCQANTSSHCHWLHWPEPLPSSQSYSRLQWLNISAVMLLSKYTSILKQNISIAIIACTQNIIFNINAVKVKKGQRQLVQPDSFTSSDWFFEKECWIPADFAISDFQLNLLAYLSTYLKSHI